jgi:hypothetical protein
MRNGFYVHVMDTSKAMHFDRFFSCKVKNTIRDRGLVAVGLVIRFFLKLWFCFKKLWFSMH